MVFRKQTFYPKVFLFNLISIIPFLHQCPSQNTDIYFDFINIHKYTNPNMQNECEAQTENNS